MKDGGVKTPIFILEAPLVIENSPLIRTLPEKLFLGTIFSVVLIAFFVGFLNILSGDEFTLEDAERYLDTEIPDEATEIELEYRDDFQDFSFLLTFTVPEAQSNEFTSQFCNDTTVDSQLSLRYYEKNCWQRGYMISIKVDLSNPELHKITLYFTRV